MPQICPRCRRANPNEAAFCYHDGVVLDASVTSNQWSRPLVLPGGRTCRTLEDLAAGLRQNWDASRDLLTSGALGQFFRDNGRQDLARIADDARSKTDPDLGLYQLIGQLPIPAGPQPRLEVSPRRLVLGPYPAGGQHQTSLRITNRGSGPLLGKIKTVGEAPWLRLGDQANPHEARIDTESSQSVGVWIDTRGLTSGQTVSARLTAVTNGGLAEIPVAIEITATPYPTAPFKGATTQRKLAELMRTHPKEAIAAIERGDVARWFAANGWAYPVSGTPAEGMGCVQQLFECMGLTKPPRLELSPAVVELVSERGRPVGGSVVLRAASKKWVYAQIESKAPWLKVRTSTVSGPQQTTIEFEADPSRLPDGATTAEAVLELIANAGTRMRVTVRIESHKPAPRRAAAGGGDWTRALMAGAIAFLLYRVLAILPADVIGRLFGAGPPTPGSMASWLSVPGTADGFLRRFVLATWWLGGVVGLVMAWKRDGKIVDLIAGLVAGSAAGLAAMATLGCILIPGDEIPRRLLGLVAARDSTMPAIVATLAWLILACGCWAMLGAVLGGLCLVLGARGRKVLGWLVAPVRWASEQVGARDLSEMFRFR